MKKFGKVLALTMLVSIAGIFTGCSLLGGFIGGGSSKITLTIVDNQARNFGTEGFTGLVDKLTDSWERTYTDNYIMPNDPDIHYFTLDYETGVKTVDITRYVEEGTKYELVLSLSGDKNHAFFIDGTGNVLKKRESDKYYSVFSPKKGYNYIATLVSFEPKDEYDSYSLNKYFFVLTEEKIK